MTKIKLLIKLLITVFTLILFCSISLADSKYTRHHAEELYHLIKWHEYSAETFQKAMREQKPIFLVLSAPAWCYWCHVYESEDYLYHPDLYPFINEHFIAVFIDSDKRPDLTKKYIVGGWPSTTLMTPDTRRINGFSGPGDPSALKQFLVRIVDFLKDKEFTEFKRELIYKSLEPSIPDESGLRDIETIVMEHIGATFDYTYGGLEGSRGQKFPTGLIYNYLLQKYDESGNADYLNMVRLAFEGQYTDIDDIDKAYHLYDPVEGGFHRYSTKKDWTVPHYEKLLGDQAGLMRAYTHLYKITGDEKVKKVIDRSASFIISKFYDESGGFFSSQDAYIEEHYYGLTKKGRDRLPPPYIDRTRNMDSNSIMISTFLYMHDVLGGEKYKAVAKKSLDFLRDRMTGDRGAYYYFDYEKGRPFLTGQAISNSWAMLAFIDGHAALGGKSYLNSARDIADYSLENLYDWDSGGFFERNSQDTGVYAPFEHIDLSKPYEENSVFSYSMLRLFLVTDDLKYLESGLKTLGYMLTLRPGGLDETYYLLQATNLVKKHGLLDDYLNRHEQIGVILEQGKSDFFLAKIFERRESEITIEDAPKLQGDSAGTSFIVLAILAFGAGILSFLSPCTLPILPAYFAQGFHTGKGEIAKNTLFFFLGLATIFSLFGMGATLIGGVLRANRLLFTQAAAVIIIILGVLEIFGKGFSGMNIQLKGVSRTPVGSYIFGSVFAVGWSACIGPILASLLILAAAVGTVLKGTSLLFIYALGLALPLIIISLFFDRIRNKRFWDLLRGKEISFSILNKKISIYSTHLISGLTLVLLGILIFNDYIYMLNQLTFQSDYVQDIIVKGEELLKNIFIN